MELNLKIDGEDAPKPSKIPKVLQELTAAKNNPLSNLNIFESHQVRRENQLFLIIFY